MSLRKTGESEWCEHKTPWWGRLAANSRTGARNVDLKTTSSPREREDDKPPLLQRNGRCRCSRRGDRKTQGPSLTETGSRNASSPTPLHVTSTGKHGTAPYFPTPQTSHFTRPPLPSKRTHSFLHSQTKSQAPFSHPRSPSQHSDIQEHDTSLRTCTVAVTHSLDNTTPSSPSPYTPSSSLPGSAVTRSPTRNTRVPAPQSDMRGTSTNWTRKNGREVVR